MNEFDRIVAKQELIETLQTQNEKLTQEVEVLKQKQQKLKHNNLTLQQKNQALEEESKQSQINDMVEIETHEVAVVNISEELQNWIEKNLYPTEDSSAVLGFKYEYDIENINLDELKYVKLKQEAEMLKEALGNMDRQYFYIRHGY